MGLIEIRLGRRAVLCPAILAATVLAATVLAAMAAPWAHAETMEGPPGRAPAEDLVLAEDYVFALDGVDLEDAEIYFSAYEVFHLVIAPQLEAPLMISPRGPRSLQWVDPDKLTKRGDIEAELAAGAAVEDLGQYTSYRGVCTFEVDGKEAKLMPRPPVLGQQSLESMRGKHRRYAHKARSYELKRADLKSKPLRRGDVLVKVFFVSTKPICERIVSRVMRFEEELRGPDKSIRFEYFGLPKDFSQDETAKALGIFGVPAAIVYVDGVEVGRLRALELDRPEENLFRLLSP